MTGIRPPDSVYTEAFFLEHVAGARASAETVLPMLMDTVRPSSVVDVGCGVGTWLAAFERHGVRDLVGIDGFVPDASLLEISPSLFVSADLTSELHLDRAFDLALCLEVAEHLPPESASVLVRSLCGLSDVLVFSAAVPSQGGTHHVNEQWPAYWCDLFREHGFTAIDWLRPVFWNDSRILPWYRQNMIMFVRRSALDKWQSLRQLAEAWPNEPLPLVHPDLYVGRVWPEDVTYASVLRQIRRLVKRRLAVLFGRSHQSGIEDPS